MKIIQIFNHAGLLYSGFFYSGFFSSGFFSSGFFSSAPFSSPFFSGLVSSGFFCQAASCSGVFFLYYPFNSLNTGLAPMIELNLIFPACSNLWPISLAKSCSLDLSTRKSFMGMVRLPITSSSSITSIKMLSTEAGHEKVRCQSFQIGCVNFVSCIFFVQRTYSPTVTLTEQCMSPKVLVLLLNQAVSNLRLMISTFSSLNVAESMMNPACFLSQLRKHLKGML